MLAVMLIAGHWKCLITMGPTFDANFCHGVVSLLCIGPMELKTPTLSAVMYILIYLLTLTHRHGIQGDAHWLLILTNGRKGCKPRTQ